VGVFVVRILRNGIQIVLKKAGNHFPFAFSFCIFLLFSYAKTHEIPEHRRIMGVFLLSISYEKQ